MAGVIGPFLFSGLLPLYIMLREGYVTLLFVNSVLDNVNCEHLAATIALMIEPIKLHWVYSTRLGQRIGVSWVGVGEEM